MKELQGAHAAAGLRVALIASRFNEEITEGLVRGARRALLGAGLREEDLVLVRVPGAFELPLAARHAARTGRFDALVCLGCLIKGDTMHFEYIASAASLGIMQVTTETGVPVGFGLLTALTEAQAADRAGEGAENKGAEAALAAVEMAMLLRRIGDGSS